MALPHLNSYSRKPSCKEIYLNKAGLDHIEIALLKIMRLFLALQEMRFARKSTFSFNAPQCNGCSLFLTEHERRLTSTISALRSGKSGLAKAEMMMLCEGITHHRPYQHSLS